VIVPGQVLHRTAILPALHSSGELRVGHPIALHKKGGLDEF